MEADSSWIQPGIVPVEILNPSLNGLTVRYPSRVKRSLDGGSHSSSRSFKLAASAIVQYHRGSDVVGFSALVKTITKPYCGGVAASDEVLHDRDRP